MARDPKLHRDFEQVKPPSPRTPGEPAFVIRPRRRCPALARPGHCVQIAGERLSFYGVIKSVHADHVIVLGAFGETLALRYNEVELSDVQPDPAFVIADDGDPSPGREAVLQAWLLLALIASVPQKPRRRRRK